MGYHASVRLDANCAYYQLKSSIFNKHGSLFVSAYYK